MTLTVNPTTPRQQYIAAAAQTVFVIPFVFFANADVTVYKSNVAGTVFTLLALGTDYTLAGAGSAPQGSLTLLVPCAGGEFVIVARASVIQRISQYPTTGAFPTVSLNQDLDQITTWMQELQLALARTLSLATADPASSVVLPVTRAGLYLAFDGSGNPIATAGPTPGGSPVSAAMAPVIAAATIAASRVLYGFPAIAAGNAGQVLQVDTAGSFQLGGQVPTMKNKIIGGDMSGNPWQRGTTFIGTSVNYSADRWQIVRATLAAGMTVSRQVAAGDTGFTSVMRIQRDNGNASALAMTVAHGMETRDATPLAGKTVTLAVRGKKGATFSGAAALNLTYGTGSDQNFISGFTGAVQLATIDLAAGLNAASFTTLVVSVAVPAAATQLAVSYVANPSGVAGANDYIDLEIVQLEDSPLFTGFDRRPLVFETPLLQRHFWKTFNQATAPVAAAGSNTGEIIASAIIAGANIMQMPIRFPTVMRSAAPTPTFFSVTSAGAQAQDLSTNALGSLTALLPSDGGGRIQFTSNAAAAQLALYGVHATFSADL